MSGYPWTDEEEKILKKLHEAGASVNEICEVLGRSDASVRSKMRAFYMNANPPKAPFTINYDLYKQIVEDI